jgi:hypothetical protein
VYSFTGQLSVFSVAAADAPSKARLPVAFQKLRTMTLRDMQKYDLEIEIPCSFMILFGLLDLS